MKEETFYSKSKETWKQYLSNFTSYDPKGQYPSVEAQFQAMKFCYSDKPQHRLTIRWKQLTPAECRQHGTKSYFKKHGITLDVAKWERDKVKIMRELLILRYTRDKRFREILENVHKKKIRLVHFSNRDKFWGAFRRKENNELVGKNMLGKLMHEIIRDQLQQIS